MPFSALSQDPDFTAFRPLASFVTRPWSISYGTALHLVMRTKPNQNLHNYVIFLTKVPALICFSGIVPVVILECFVAATGEETMRHSPSLSSSTGKRLLSGYLAQRDKDALVFSAGEMRKCKPPKSMTETDTPEAEFSDISH